MADVKPDCDSEEVVVSRGHISRTGLPEWFYDYFSIELFFLRTTVVLSYEENFLDGRKAKFDERPEKLVVKCLFSRFSC